MYCTSTRFYSYPISSCLTFPVFSRLASASRLTSPVFSRLFVVFTTGWVFTPVCCLHACQMSSRPSSVSTLVWCLHACLVSPRLTDVCTPVCCLQPCLVSQRLSSISMPVWYFQPFLVFAHLLLLLKAWLETSSGTCK